MSGCLHASDPAANPPRQAGAARLAKFKREQLIVDYLNRGVSVVEIAARIGVGEKRMRAIIREILARRLPQPPMEFVAIQTSRLNEALLVAFSAMSPTNLKAVDQVVKIVRELDRYGGAFAAEWARPETTALDAPAEADVAFAKAWLGDAELMQDRGDDRPDNLSQTLEKIDSAPGIGAASEAADAVPLPRADAQGRKRADASPRSCSASETAEEGHPQGIGRAPRGGAGVAGRPENLGQVLENMDSAPGLVDIPDLTPSLTEDALLAADGAARSALPDATLRAVPRHESGESRLTPPQSDDRPGNLAQGLENMDSAPGNGWRPGAAFGAGGAFVSRTFPNPPCPEFLRVRATPNGLAA